MGDRALVVFTGTTAYGEQEPIVSPVVYVHWLGDRVPQMLGRLTEVMKGRANDAEYAAARFAAICCEAAPGNLSVGLLNLHADQIAAIVANDTERMKGMSHGDAGFIVVNAKTWDYKVYGGYLRSGNAAGAAVA